MEMREMNLDSLFLQEAASVLDAIAQRKNSASARKFTDGTEIRNFARSFAPTSHNRRNREKCLNFLRQERANFALLSGDQSIAHFARGIFPTSPTDIGQVELSELLGVASRQEREQCKRVALEFSRLIEAICALPTVDTEAR